MVKWPKRPGLRLLLDDILERLGVVWREVLQDGVPHPIPLGTQITLVHFVGSDLNRYALHNLQSVTGDPHTLARVVRHEAQLAYAEITQDLTTNAVIPQVHVEAQRLISFYRVEPLFFLQLLSAQLVQQPDTAPLLLHVEDNSLSGLLHLKHSPRELVTTVTPLGSKNIPSDAL